MTHVTDAAKPWWRLFGSAMAFDLKQTFLSVKHENAHIEKTHECRNAHYINRQRFSDINADKGPGVTIPLHFCYFPMALILFRELFIELGTFLRT